MYAESIAAIDPRTAGKEPQDCAAKVAGSTPSPVAELRNGASARRSACAGIYGSVMPDPGPDAETKGRGASRRAAEQQAARAALDRIEKL